MKLYLKDDEMFVYVRTADWRKLVVVDEVNKK